MTEVDKTKGGQTPETPAKAETKPEEGNPATPAETTPPETPKEEEKVTISKKEHDDLLAIKAKAEKKKERVDERGKHLFQKNRSLKKRLHAEKPEQAQQEEAEEAQKLREALTDVIFSDSRYAQLFSQNRALRELLRRDPTALISDNEVIYDIEDFKEVLKESLDAEVAKLQLTPQNQTTEDNTPESDKETSSPKPATPPSESSPHEPEKEESKSSSKAEESREPTKQVEGSIADKMKEQWG